MPILNITNISRYKLPINDIIGILEKGESRSLELTLNEIERSRTQLVALTNYGLIKWSTAANDDPTDDDAEGSLVSSSVSSNPITDVYLSGVSGNDGNNGLAPSTAVKTFTRVWELLPKVVTEPFVVHIGKHGGSGYNYVLPPNDRVFAEGAFIVLYGDGAGQAGEDGFTVIRSGSAGASTTNLVLEVDGSVPSDNQFNSYTVEFITGNAVGYRRHIRDNVGAVCTLNASLESVTATKSPSSGDSYRVLEPSAVLMLPVTGQAARFASNDSFDITNLAEDNIPIHCVNILLDASALRYLFMSNKTSLFYGVTIADPNRLVLGQSNIFAGVTDFGNQPDEVKLLFEAIKHTHLSGDWHGWGLAWKNNAVGSAGVRTSYLFSRAQGVGSFYFEGFLNTSRVDLFGYGLFRLIGGYIYGFGCQQVDVSISVGSLQASNIVQNSIKVAAFATFRSCQVMFELNSTVSNSMDFTSQFQLFDGARVQGNVRISAQRLQIFGGASLDSASGNTITLTAPGATAVDIFRNGSLTAANLTIQDSSLGISVDGGSKCHIFGTTTLVSTGKCILVSGGSSFSTSSAFGGNGTLTCTGVENTEGVVIVEAESSFAQVATNPITITNTGTGSGIVSRSGGRISLKGSTSTVITSSGVAYDARFGGRIDFENAPNANAGSGSDFIVDTSDGNKTFSVNLTAAETGYSSSNGNGSVVARKN